VEEKGRWDLKQTIGLEKTERNSSQIIYDGLAYRSTFSFS
jgi:hypothetical protein